MITHEINYDGLVGPTHNFAGSAFGNLASMRHGGDVSNPRKAAKEGLQKVKLMADLGLKQAILPPHSRPNLGFLRALGFTGDDVAVVDSAWKSDKELVVAAYSASSMWVANAATVSPSSDTVDGRVHFTPANLTTMLHRSIEPSFNALLLKVLFSSQKHFCHHAPLPSQHRLADEGAANHTRLASSYGTRGIELFVHGSNSNSLDARLKLPARQSYLASLAIARMHGLERELVVHVRQHVEAINRGVFHNDVICVGDLGTLLVHEKAFESQQEMTNRLRRLYDGVSEDRLEVVEISQGMLTLEDAVESYLFNSQLVTLAGGEQVLITPVGCLNLEAAKSSLEYIVETGRRIKEIKYVDLSESLKNGGGPACLRLRVVLTDEELVNAHQGVMVNDVLCKRLEGWVDDHYRDRLTLDDLRDPELIGEGKVALDELTKVLDIGPLYPFQMAG